MKFRGLGETKLVVIYEMEFVAKALQKTAEEYP